MYIGFMTDILLVVGVCAVFALLFGFIVVFLTTLRRPERAAYRDLQARLGMTGPLRWDWVALEVDWRGTREGLPVRVLFVSGDDSPDVWELSCSGGRAHPTRSVASVGHVQRTEWDAGLPVGDAALDATLRVIGAPAAPLDRDEVVALRRLAEIPGLARVDWSREHVTVRIHEQFLPPSHLEAVLRELVILGR